MTPIRFKSWRRKAFPKKVLAIRLQALGDAVITLPYLNDFKIKNPNTVLDFLTRKEIAEIFKNLHLFDQVITIGGHRNVIRQLISTIFKIPTLWFKGYDVVLDLQNNKISRLIRLLLNPAAWSEFDRYSPIAAGERTRLTIQLVGLSSIAMNTSFTFKQSNASAILSSEGWKGDSELIVLNPAGYCSSRNWSLTSYVAFANLWRERVNPKTQFVLLLLPSMKTKADYIKKFLGEACIDLTGKANQFEAFSIIQQCKLMISEDSGLMHMSWVQSIPTLALFSSSRKDWSTPLGIHSLCLDSSDMDCGPCGLSECKFNDNRCINRYSPEYILEQARKLL